MTTDRLPKSWVYETAHGSASVYGRSKSRKWLKRRLERGRILVDTETDGVSHDRKLRLVQVGWRDRCYLIDPGEHPKVVRRIMDSDTEIVAHNAAFDLLSLALWRWPTDHDRARDWVVSQRRRAIDTMVHDQIAASSVRSRRLAALAADAGVGNMPEERWNDRADELGLTHAQKYAAMPLSEPAMMEYAAHDVWQLWAAYSAQEDAADDGPDAATVADETAAEVLYAVMAHRGLAVDLAALESVYETKQRALETVTADLASAGIDNVGSTAQVAAALEAAGAKITRRTPSGKPATDKRALAELSKQRAGAVAALVLTARSLRRDSTMALNIARSAAGGRVRPKVWRIGAVTARSTYADPPLHQLNKHAGDTAQRSAILADEGHVLVTVDYAGFQLRIIANLTGDRKLAKHLKKGDVHGRIAARIFGRSYSESQRHQAKGAVFAMLFGAGADTIAGNTGMAPKQAAKSLQAWRDEYPDCWRQSEKWRKDAAKRGFVELPNGWRVPSPSKHTAVNYHVQTTEAFLFRQAALRLADAGMWQHVIMVFHDEFVFSFPKKKAKKLANKAVKVMEFPGELVDYTASAEIREGREWT